MSCVTPVKGLWKTALVQCSHAWRFSPLLPRTTASSAGRFAYNTGPLIVSILCCQSDCSLLDGCGQDLLRREGFANHAANFLESFVSAQGKDGPVSPNGPLVFQVRVPTKFDFNEVFLTAQATGHGALHSRTREQRTELVLLTECKASQLF